MERDTESESEQAGLLARNGIRIEVLNREVTTVESRLIIVAFVFLCLGSIGFGLFAGEVSKYEKLEHGERITMTVTAPSGKPTSPPTQPDKFCSSGPCIEASAELMKTINWDADPCRDFDRFAMRRTQTPATDAIKADINHFIKNLLFKQLHPTTRTLEKFYSTCTHFTDLYEEALPLLKKITIVWNGTDPLDWSRTTRFTSALAYTHARALPAFFKNSLANERTRITPAPLNVTGLEKAFRNIYSRSEVTRRLEGVKELKAQLDEIIGYQSPSLLVSLDELQNLVCDDRLAPCLLRWKDYYSSLSSIRPMSKVIVDGIEYFRRLPSVVAAQSDETIESYFHWMTISALVLVDCSRDLRWFFGPLLARHYFSTLSDGRNDLQVKAETAHFVLSSVLNSTSEHPIEIVFPPIEDDQVEELAAVEKGDHIGNLLRLAQIKTRKMFDEHQMSWDMLEPAL
ncbi:hypothetical protein CROQUDRAFT_36291 [Cronartium quercuum f. sp. fusiforme G11]|uniref:Uncharacterized protein n=1 Tax=Cronartium quercuum f. sp. fusiforme G11 TaxID=708437 RepID=A0A9P6NYD5_9BASI|nr:hypothetical protein CROQUDRAFT_36291 [Cronartium quercuum f. sp. fusiforme G11]